MVRGVVRGGGGERDVCKQLGKGAGGSNAKQADGKVNGGATLTVLGSCVGFTLSSPSSMDVATAACTTAIASMDVPCRLAAAAGIFTAYRPRQSVGSI